MDDKVYIIHPKVPDAAPSVQTRMAFEDVWKAKGWQVISEEKAAALSAKLTEKPAKPESEAPAEDTSVADRVTAKAKGVAA